MSRARGKRPSPAQRRRADDDWGKTIEVVRVFAGQWTLRRADDVRPHNWRPLQVIVFLPCLRMVAVAGEGSRMLQYLLKGGYGS